MKKKTDHPLFRLWCNRRQSCNNTNNPGWFSYGGRGIKFYPQWDQDFWAFAEWMDENLGPRPGCSSIWVLDRINNDKGFKPGNLRWATRQEDSNNRSTNTTLTYKGRKQTYADWSRELGIPLCTIWSRINDRGMSIHKAFTTPVNKHIINNRKK